MTNIRVEPVAVLPGESQKWMILVNGYQVGGVVDRSGAGDQIYDSQAEAYRIKRRLQRRLRESGGSRA